MTRFARKGGFAEKKEITRKKEDATQWENMFDEKAEKRKQSDDDPNEQEEEKIKKHEEDYNKRIELENSNVVRNNKETKKFKSKQNDDHYYERYAESIDKEVLKELIELKNKRLITYYEFQDRLYREERTNKRRLERMHDRETKRVCFRCRKPGHSVNECEEMKKDNEHGTGICYKCGSTEHSVHQCKVKVESGNYPFAKCFICNEVGHITKQCPDNPRGLYPNGGACKNCGSVEHYARDCPEIQKQNLLAETKTLKKVRPKDNLDILSDEEVKKEINEKPKKKKVVVF